MTEDLKDTPGPESTIWLEVLCMEVAVTQIDHMIRGRLAFALGYALHAAGMDAAEPVAWGRLYVLCPVCGRGDPMLDAPRPKWFMGEELHYCECDSVVVPDDLVVDPGWIAELVANRVTPTRPEAVAPVINTEWLAALAVPRRGTIVGDPADLWPPPMPPPRPVAAEPLLGGPPDVRCIAEPALLGDDKVTVCEGIKDPWAIPLPEVAGYLDTAERYCPKCLYEITRRASVDRAKVEHARDSAAARAVMEGA